MGFLHSEPVTESTVWLRTQVDTGQTASKRDACRMHQTARDINASLEKQQKVAMLRPVQCNSGAGFVTGPISALSGLAG